jgi:DNA-binding GntR family transcriptional regulator
VLSEAALAESLGISRTPVREALMQLAAEGLIDYSAFYGTRVHTVTESERQEIFLLRSTLELLAVERLTPTATPEQVAILDALLAQQRAHARHQDWASFIVIDAEFHLKLAELAGLTVTQKFLGQIRNMFHLMGLTAMSVPGRSEQVLAEHAAVIAAIRDHAADRAAQAISNHLSRTERLIESFQS